MEVQPEHPSGSDPLYEKEVLPRAKPFELRPDLVSESPAIRRDVGTGQQEVWGENIGNRGPLSHVSVAKVGAR